MPALTVRPQPAEVERLSGFVRVLSPGFELYSRYCANCHGDDGRGVNELGTPFEVPSTVFDSDYFRRKDPDRLRSDSWHMLASEKPSMPHFRWTLSRPQLRAILEYLKKPE
jgi:mono/diheme cytochrome c family protein